MSETTPKPGSEPLKGRREKFCQIIAQNNTSANEAYRQVYKGKNPNVCSPRMMANVGTKARIAYLRAELEQKTQKKVLYTRTQAIAELDMAIELAKRVDQPAAVVSAVKAKSDLCGLNIDAAQNPADRPLMTREELLEALAELDGVSEQARIIQLQVNKRVG